MAEASAEALQTNSLNTETFRKKDGKDFMIDSVEGGKWWKWLRVSQRFLAGDKWAVSGFIELRDMDRKIFPERRSMREKAVGKRKTFRCTLGMENRRHQVIQAECSADSTPGGSSGSQRQHPRLPRGWAEDRDVKRQAHILGVTGPRCQSLWLSTLTLYFISHFCS